MARLRKNETSVNTAPAASAAATARRATSAPRKRITAKSAAGEPAEPVEEILAAADSISETAIAYEPSHEEISALAYSYWVDRGYVEGSREQDWLRAEAELRRRGRAGE
jgi:hypothetical protein